MKKSKSSGQSWLEIVIILIITFLIFVGTVLMYEEKIDELEKIIIEMREQC